MAFAQGRFELVVGVDGQPKKVQGFPASSSDVRGVAPRVVWRPNGGGDATTWAQVVALVGSQAGVEIYCDDVGDVPYTVTAPATPGVTDMHGAFFVTPPDRTTIVTVQTGVTLRDVVGYENVALVMQGTAALTFSAPLNIAAVSFKGEIASGIEASGSVNPITVANGTQLVVSCSGRVSFSKDTIEVFNLVGTAILGLECHDLAGNVLDDDSVKGANTSTLNVIHDGSFQEVFTLSTMLGTIAAGVYGTEGGAGVSTMRPTTAVLAVKKGTTFYDTEAARTIEYDGTLWSVVNQVFHATAGGAPIVITASTVVASLTGVVLEAGGWAHIVGQMNVTQGGGAPGDLALSLRVTRTTPPAAPVIFGVSALPAVPDGKVASVVLSRSIQIGGGIGPGTYTFELLGTSTGGTSTVPADTGDVPGADLTLRLST